MNAKQLLDKIKLALMDEPAPSGETKVEMMTAKLKDGTEITYDVLAVGGVVMIGDVPAPVGEHMLENGTVITLADNGVIVEIKEADVVEAPAEVVAPATDVIEARFAAIEKHTSEKFAAYENKFAQYEAKLNKANTVIEGLLGLTQLLVEQPTAKADGATSGAAFAAQTAEEKLNNYSKILFTKKK